MPATPKTAFAISPNIGPFGTRYLRLVSNLSRASDSDSQYKALDGVRKCISLETAKPPELKLAFVASLLADVVSVGGHITVRDSVPHVAWPAWDTEAVQGSIRATMRQRFGDFAFSVDDLAVIERMFLPDLTPSQLEQVAFSGTFRLRSSSDVHPTGFTYSRAFAVGVKTWSMPYRGREGRSKRFLLTVEHALLNSERVVGLLEVGDDAPISGHRDRLLTLTRESVVEHLERLAPAARESACNVISGRFRELRRNLNLGDKYLNLSASEVLIQRHKLEALASGRSTNGVDAEKRRLTYLLRLSAGEVAFQQFARGEAPDEGILAAGVRALHNITLPRVHSEITVCGAVPPFSGILGGKAVTAMAAHPKVRAMTAGGLGQILGETFDSKILELLPQADVVLLTTKGLYPGHASIYNRALVPNGGNALRFSRVGLTKGDTTAMLSDETAQIAIALQSADETGKVSRAFGSGGGKRHRTIIAAARVAGLPSGLASTGIQRPVYALPLLDNTFDAIWLLESPEWRISRTESDAQYEAAAMNLWRQRWRPQILGRIEAAYVHVGLKSQRAV